jgi:hypothetical protein
LSGHYLVSQKAGVFEHLVLNPAEDAWDTVMTGTKVHVFIDKRKPKKDSMPADSQLLCKVVSALIKTHT